MRFTSGSIIPKHISITKFVHSYYFRLNQIITRNIVNTFFNKTLCSRSALIFTDYKSLPVPFLFTKYFTILSKRTSRLMSKIYKYLEETGTYKYQLTPLSILKPFVYIYMCLRQLRSCFKTEAAVLSNTLIPGLTFYSTFHSLNKKLSCNTSPIECHVNLYFFLSETLTLQTCVLDRVLSEQLSYSCLIT